MQRFVDAQADGVFDQAMSELRRGEKRTHWMWFVFPQLAGLGRSETARHYAIADLDEARSYLAHPLLGDRLVAAMEAAAQSPAGADADRLMGPVDAMKLRSSATLFEAAGGGSAPAAVLDILFGGRRDGATLSLLGFSHPS
nr:DUF1810 domain-containing protein [Sphingomonas jejuensis]